MRRSTPYFLKREQIVPLTRCAKDVNKFPNGIYFVEVMLTGENVFRALITKWTKHFVNEEKGKGRHSDDQEHLI